MAPRYGDRVKETSDIVGTGTLGLNGAVSGFRAFITEFNSGDDQISYLIVDDPATPTKWEVGKGTITSGVPNTLSRDTVEASTNADALVSFVSGTKTVVALPSSADLNAALIPDSNSEILSAASLMLGSATVRPDGTLHVHKATAGAVIASVNADIIVVESNTAGGISILTPDASIGALFFGSPTDPIGAELTWQQSTLEMIIGTRSSGGAELVFHYANGAEGMRLGSNGNLLLGGTAGDGTATKTLTVFNGTEAAAAVANAVEFYSIDDASGHTIPAFWCEGTNVVATSQADSVSSVRVKMRINGTTRTFLCI